ncbi:putative tight adherance operon protein [Yersinia frederiksenii]|uniref:Putative tight adherance operon protein n=1 Tax=Yersinia frederiksenii TaxID=29484 RepID=A0A380PU15_YERFR|nr:type II and III secretion system protein family protein [Yersinia frederiksenii]ATM94416.1 secretin [Yersinia frederiksenii]SUP77090.1 putative tight adherance operon protein [Yersinia frederiksenii]
MKKIRLAYISWYLLFTTITCLITAQGANAKPVYLSAGESYIINTQDEINTVFVSAAAIADYELIGKNSIIVYAKNEGVAEFTLFNHDHKAITKSVVLVNNIIPSVHRRIQAEYPESNIDINKIGSSYILTGLVESEEVRDTVVNIIGEAIGSKRINNDRHPVGNTNHTNIINKIKLSQSNQVNVKLTIAEVTKDFTENIGINWSTIGESVGSFQLFKFNAKGISTLVHAINDNAIARVLAEPNLSVLSGEDASFLVGGEIPIVNTTQNGSAVSYKEFGIKLNIGAKVNDKKRIRIILNEEVSSIGKTFNINGGDSYPSIRTRKAATTLELGDGESFILGGLISRNERESLKKIPLMGDIPLLGAFFRNAQTEQSQTELVVIATVNLVNPVAEKEVELPDFMQTSTLERFFNFTHIMEIKREKAARAFLRKGGFIK